MSIRDFVATVRQNHALEHATIHVLSQQNPYVRLIGRSSTPSGFVIYGPLSKEEIEAAAREALARLQGGEAHLAVHPRCGTNLAVTGVLAGVAAFGVTLGRPRSRFERLPWALVAATVAAMVAQPLGHTIQEQITTSPEVDGLYIADVARYGRGGFTAHKVTVGRG